MHTAVTIEEPSYSPQLVGQWIHNIDPSCLDSVNTLCILSKKNRDYRVYWYRGIGGDRAKLMICIVARRDNPAIIHEYVKSKDYLVLRNCFG